MKAERAPESADRGWWYVVKAVPDPLEGGLTPGIIPGSGWCCWYGEVEGVMYAAVRTPAPVVGVETVDVPVSAVIEAAVAAGDLEESAKPYGRIRGR